MDAKKYTVTILGTKYSLLSDEPEEFVNNSVSFIDELIQEISKSANLSSEKIVVFALIKAALKVSAVNSELENYKNSTKKLEAVLNQPY